MSRSRVKLVFDLVQPAVDRLLLGHQLHEQAVVREVRTAEDGEQGQGHADDASPVACGKTNDVVMLKGHVSTCTWKVSMVVPVGLFVTVTVIGPAGTEQNAVNAT